MEDREQNATTRDYLHARRCPARPGEKLAHSPAKASKRTEEQRREKGLRPGHSFTRMPFPLRDSFSALVSWSRARAQQPNVEASGPARCLRPGIPPVRPAKAGCSIPPI